MEILPLGGALGAELRGVDVLDPSPEDVDSIRDALHAHEVVFLRDTALDDEAHLAFAARFGSPSVFPLNRAMGDTRPTFQVIRDDAESPPSADYWHTDVTWTELPPAAAFLRVTIVPDRGGDTMWGSMTAAYEALSKELRGFLDRLTVRHDNASFIRGMQKKIGEQAAAPIAKRLREAYPPVVHPLVRTHPETGRRALMWGGRFMRGIVELSEREEAEQRLALALGQLDDPVFHVRWRWRPGDLAIWDECSTVHRGLSDHFPRVREVRRCVIDGRSGS